MKKAKKAPRVVTVGNPAYVAGAQALRFGNAAGAHRQGRPRSAVRRKAIADSREL